MQLYRHCLICETKFFKSKTCSVRNWATRSKYCSKKCQHKSMIGTKQSQETKDKRAFALKNRPGVRVDYLYYRKLCLERDNYTCIQCGWNEVLIMEVDHIIPKIIRPDLSNNLDNLQTLCPNCHRRKTLQNKENSVKNNL